MQRQDIMENKDNHLDIDALLKIVECICCTEDEEIGCVDCYDDMDNFVQMHLDGKSPEEALPLVKHHLDICPACQEEYQALLQAMESIDKDEG